MYKLKKGNDQVVIGNNYIVILIKLGENVLKQINNRQT